MTQSIIWFNLNKYSEQFNKYSIKQNSSYLVAPDLFYIDTLNDKYIVFAPLLYRVYYIPKQYISSTTPLILNEENLDELIKANLFLPEDIINSLYPTKKDCKTFNPNIRLLLTTACNLNCVYCYANANKTSNLISIENLQSFINSVPSNVKALEIEFHGGEPTVAFKRMQETYNLIVSKFPESTFMIQTNGVFNDKVMDWLISNNIRINFSIDGDEETHNIQRPAISINTNSFKELLRNIKKAQEKGTGTACIVTVTAFNLDKMQDTFNFLKEHNFKYIKFNPLFEEGRALADSKSTMSSPNLETFAKNLAKISIEAFQKKIMIDSDLLPNIHTKKASYYRCGAVCSQMTICADGNIIACADAYYLTEDKNDNPFFFSSINENSIIYNEGHQQILNNSTADNYPICQKCFLKWHCSGGCKIENYLKNKDIMIPDSVSCNAKQIFLTEYLKEIGSNIL